MIARGAFDGVGNFRVDRAVDKLALADAGEADAGLAKAVLENAEELNSLGVVGKPAARLVNLSAKSLRLVFILGEVLHHLDVGLEALNIVFDLRDFRARAGNVRLDRHEVVVPDDESQGKGEDDSRREYLFLFFRQLHCFLLGCSQLLSCWLLALVTWLRLRSWDW